MDRIRRALAALVCALALAAPIAAPAAAPRMAGEVRRFADTVLATRDHEGRPFAIVDKKRARIHVFDAAGRLRGASTVLLGQTPGDGSAPDVGENTQNGYVPIAERTTPAGRFLAEPGLNLNGEHVIWVDYDAAFAIHRLRAGPSHALRAARLASQSPEDKRLSLGCIVVPVRFYTRVIGALLGQGPSVVYVLPEQGDAASLLLAHQSGQDVAASASAAGG